jgi:hypothetical protein
VKIVDTGEKMTELRKTLTMLMIAVWLFFPARADAQADDEPVVRAVLFYSPTCPHCHEVINELLMPMTAEYGDQLWIAGVDTSQPGGAQLYQAAIQRYQVPDERRGVPTLVIKDVVLVGSLEIPDQFPGLVEESLVSGGIDWPDIPGLDEWVTMVEHEPGPESAAPATDSPDAVTTQPDTDDALCQDVLEGCEEQPGGSTAPQAVAPEVYGPLPAPVTASEPSAGPAISARDGSVRLVFFWSDT